MTDVKDWPVVTAVCCREWPVFAGLPINRCGYCNERPVVKR